MLGLWGNNLTIPMAAHPIGFNYSNSLFIVRYKNDTSHAIRLFFVHFSIFHPFVIGLIREAEAANVLLMFGNKASLFM